MANTKVKPQAEGKLVRIAQAGDIITIPGKKGTYFVEEAYFTGGGPTGYIGDTYPDAWHVYARKMTGNKINTRAKRIVFTMDTNCYSDVIEGVRKIGQVKKIVTVQWEKTKR